MKKFTALAIAVVLMTNLAIPAFAATITQDSNPRSADALIEYEVAEQYNVTVPADVTLLYDIDTKVATNVERSISATGLIAIDRELSVTVSSNNYSDSWNVVNTVDDVSTAISYSITNGGQAVTDGSKVLSMVSGETEAEEELTFLMTGTPVVAGEYSDSLTFTVTVSNVSSDT